MEFHSLPASVPGTNVDATEEEEGDPYEAFASGHSVWYRFEAPSDGYYLVDGCDTDFRLILRVFESEGAGWGEELGAGNAGEGPNCPDSGRSRIVRGSAGSDYLVMVDGSEFSSPFGGTAEPVGEFWLRVEELPAPPNDDFDNAESIGGEVSEEPDGSRFYHATTSGRTWGAGREAGEPEHNGSPYGASVWFAWTAPEDGLARGSACCGWPSVSRFYSGDSVDDLRPVEVVDDLPGGDRYEVSAGETYRIAVDGEYDPEADVARMGSFGLRVSMELADADPPGDDGDDGDSGKGELVPVIELPARDAVKPGTAFGGQRIVARRRLAVFFLRSNERARFICRVDRRRWRRCASRVVLRKLRPGRHVLRVRAVDLAGNFDATPAVRRFRMPWPSARVRARAIRRIRARAKARARARARARQRAN